MAAGEGSAGRMCARRVDVIKYESKRLSQDSMPQATRPKLESGVAGFVTGSKKSGWNDCNDGRLQRCHLTNTRVCREVGWRE